MVEGEGYGICRLCLVSIKSEPKNQSLQISQLLFGEHYAVLATSEDALWMKIVQYVDGAQGWIRSDQHFEISEGYYQQINSSDYKVCLDISATILFRKNNIPILLGSVLPIATTEMFKMEEKLAFNGEAKSLSQKRDGEFLVTNAMKYIGAPFVSGGKSPMGIDDAGLIQQVYKICGYRLKRDLLALEMQGEAVDKIENLAAGDVLYIGKDKPEHAKIYIGNDELITIKGYVQREKLDRAQIPEYRVIKRYLKI
jgi:hypothetical protein